MTFIPEYLFEGEPALGETMEVRPGIHWLRMPLPFRLDHINLWLLEGGDGWTIVDTGICRDEVKAAWETLFAGVMGNRPVKRVVVTHFHPDHAGLAGWLTERFDAPLVMPLTEWTFARMLSLDGQDQSQNAFNAFYKRAGFTDEMMQTVSKRVGGYRNIVSPIPTQFERIADGDTIDIGGRKWRMIVGRGHSPEHACLYCDADDVLISGDQVLPKISPNVSVWPQEPEGRPLKLFIDTIDRLRKEVGGDPLVLPSHNWPFQGFHARLDDLDAHHVDRLDETVEALEQGSTGVEVLYRLFRRELDEHQTFFAIGETLAHLHHLLEDGRAVRTRRDDGVDIFTKAA
jgi:glyoxylase-like metal-dependent hydrolase (beta-lactamase superfamily II)